MKTRFRGDRIFELFGEYVNMQFSKAGIWEQCNLLQCWRENGDRIWNSWFSLSPCNFILSYSFHWSDEDGTFQAFTQKMGKPTRVGLTRDYEKKNTGLHMEWHRDQILKTS